MLWPNNIGRENTRYILLICLACALFFMGCPGQVSFPEKDLRIISLAPSITEILFALGLGKNIVGITTCCDYPPETESIEKVATFSGRANLERILQLKPDIVFSTGLEQAPLVKQLNALKIKVVVVFPRNFAELFRSIQEIGRITQRQEQAQDLIHRMKYRMERIKQRVEAIPEAERPKVFVEIWPEPLITAGGGSFIDELITLAGGKNIAKDTERAFSQFSPEVVLQRNPDFIILGYMQPGTTPSPIQQRIGWQDIQAVKKGQVIQDINPDLFLRPGPRLVEGLEQIHFRIFR